MSDIYLEHNGEKVAVVHGYTSQRSDSNWFLKLNCVYACENISMSNLLHFNSLRMVVKREIGDLIYDDCYIQAYCTAQTGYGMFETLWVNSYKRTE